MIRAFEWNSIMLKINFDFDQFVSDIRERCPSKYESAKVFDKIGKCRQVVVNYTEYRPFYEIASLSSELRHKLEELDVETVALEHADSLQDFFLEGLSQPFPSFSFYFSMRDAYGNVTELLEETLCNACGYTHEDSFKQIYSAHCFKVDEKRLFVLNEDFDLNQAHLFPSQDNLEDFVRLILTRNKPLQSLYDLLPDIALTS